MSLYASRRCLDIAGRVAGGSNALARTWTITSTLVVQRRCYANPSSAQKLKEKPAVNASAPPSTSRTSGKAQTPQDAAKEGTAAERTAEDELRHLEALHRMSETNVVDISSVPLDLLGMWSIRLRCGARALIWAQT